MWSFVCPDRGDCLRLRYSPEAAYGLAQKGFWTSDTRWPWAVDTKSCNNVVVLYTEPTLKLNLGSLEGAMKVEQLRRATVQRSSSKCCPWPPQQMAASVVQVSAKVVFSTALNLRKVRIQQAASNHPQDFVARASQETGNIRGGYLLARTSCAMAPWRLVGCPCHAWSRPHQFLRIPPHPGVVSSMPRKAADQPHCDSYQAIAPVVQREAGAKDQITMDGRSWHRLGQVAWSGALASPAHCLRIRPRRTAFPFPACWSLQFAKSLAGCSPPRRPFGKEVPTSLCGCVYHWRSGSC